MVAKYGQAFYEAEANEVFPEGCKCGNNGGGDCDWCMVYYYELGDDPDSTVISTGKEWNESRFPWLGRRCCPL